MAAHTLHWTSIFRRSPLWLWCAALVWAGSAALPALADDYSRSYRIEAGALTPALQAFAQRANVLLTFSSSQTRGRHTAGLHGDYSVLGGFNQLLSGTGLAAEPLPGGGYRLRELPPDAPAALAPVAVSANQLGEITDGSGRYTTGALATATRLVMSPKETPQSISVVTRQEMADFQLNAIDDVMTHMPGVSIATYDSERTEYYARGFAIQNFQYDGIPMMRNSAYSAGNTLSDMATYDRVEVLRGATGLLNGSGYPGATINLIRKKPTPTFQGQVSGSVGRWNDYRGELDVAGPLTADGGVRGRAVAVHQDRNSQLDGYQRDTTVLYGIIEANLGDSTLLTLGADYQDNQPTRSTWGGNPIYTRDGRFNHRSRSFNNGADWSHWDQYTRTLFATLEHFHANDWVTKLQLNHQINGYRAELGSVAGGHPDSATGTGTLMWTGKYVGETRSDAADVYASGPFELAGRRHELVVGGSVSRSTWHNRNYDEQPGYDDVVPDYYRWTGRVPEPNWQLSSRNHEVTTEQGLYLTARFDLHQQLKLITGTRLSNYKDEDLRERGVWVPYVGLIYDLRPELSLYTSYSSIFLPQSERDLQGRRLDPLEGVNYEGGLKAELLQQRLTATLSYFQLEQDNFAQASGGTTPTGEPAFRAVNGVRTKGHELELVGALSERWNLHASYTHKIARRHGDKVDTLSPENQLRLYATYDFADQLDGLTLGGGARWMDKTWGDVSYPPSNGIRRHTVDDYWVLDAMARYRINDRLSASLSVTNLLDEKYYSIFSWYGTYTWGEPRNTRLNVTYRF
ncbi:TonB-dependent siderophore receptor [Isoalcanivorax beigongshangi]|uniref:TonB-dependent siderophore receptor n=1 Tax=Isoalcanivorax beigongshangi TaxID=3238810 RepID=A0ABV4AHL5_9GAMM